jgi:ketosteroid isomerase-like protein
MFKAFIQAAFGIFLLAACAMPAPRPDLAQSRQQVAATERAFAKTMADRDHAAFSTFLSDETVFFSGAQPVRGRQAVAEQWKRYFEQSQAPFSWEPAEIEVLDSGTLALSSGPVRDPDGKQIASFTSIWRLEAPGTWRIIFDKGCDACVCRR